MQLHEKGKTVSSGSKHAGYKVLFALLLTSVAIGVTAYYRFIQSEKHLTERFEHFVQVGSNLTAYECVDEVMAWSRECSAMLSLCQDSVQRMMSGCLHAQDRSALCADVEAVRRSTSFGYDDCKSRDLDRVRKKACADSYRAIDKFCEGILSR